MAKQNGGASPEPFRSFNPTVRTVRQLLTLYDRILSELTRRRVTRSRNNPVADYAEWLVARNMELKLSAKSNAGYDAVDDSDMRYEIKCRRLCPQNHSRQLSPFRNLEAHHFDYLVGIVFEQDFSVLKACIVPWAYVMQTATHREHVNGHVFHLRDSVWDAPGVKDITLELQIYQSEQNT